MSIFYLVLGIVGMLLILVGFIQEQRGKLKRTNTAYDAINFIGGLLLVIYAVSGRAWPFVILNGVWTLYSFRDLILKK